MKEPKNKTIKELLMNRKRRLKQLEKEVENTPKYISYSKKEKKVFEKLKSLLNDELTEVLIIYLQILEKIVSYQSEYYYDSGFKDCAELAMSLKDKQYSKGESTS